MSGTPVGLASLPAGLPRPHDPAGRALQAAAEDRGFAVAWTPLELPEEWKESYRRWLRERREAGLGELSRALEVRLQPQLRFAWARSAMLLVAPHAYPDPGTPDGGLRTGRVARRFWVREPDPFFLKRLLEPQVEALKDLAHRLGVRARDYIDQGPLPLNLYAVRSGLFWRGFNAMPLNPTLGTRVTLACLLTDLPVAAAPEHPDRCASCRRCVAGCPTGALLGDRRVDLNLCVSYWTTRHQGQVPAEMWPGIGAWLFGCDVCQDVCPWNGRAERGGLAWEGFAAEPDLAHPDLMDFLTLSGPAFAGRYRATAFERAGRVRMTRNALIVLANSPEPAHQAAIGLALEDPAPLVRATAARALVRAGRRPAAERLLNDPDPAVRAAARDALEGVPTGAGP